MSVLKSIEETHLVVARDEAADVRLAPLAIAGVVYLAVLVALVDLAQEVIVAEDFEKYLVGVLLSPLALASILPPPPERSFWRTVGVTVAGAVAAAGPGVAIGAAGAGAFTGGLAAPAGGFIGGIVGALIGGGAGLAASWSGKKECIRRGRKHGSDEYVCPNTKKYNPRPSELVIPPDYLLSEGDARIYLGVYFDLTVDDAERAARKIYERASEDGDLRKSRLGSETRILRDDFMELVRREDWLAGENDA